MTPSGPKAPEGDEGRALAGVEGLRPEVPAEGGEGDWPEVPAVGDEEDWPEVPDGAPGPFVLVHGAFRGPWAWDFVRPRLEAAGHEVHTPDLSAPDATLSSCIGILEDLISGRGLARVRLVGHSQGGFVVRAASQHLAFALGELAYLDAPVPAHGQRAFDFRPDGAPEPAVGWGDVVAPRPLAPGPGVSSAQAAWINERLVPQAAAVSMAPVRLDDPAALGLPERYAFCSLTPPGYPCEATRAACDRSGIPYALLDAAHDAPVTAPDAVAAWLLGTD